MEKKIKKRSVFVDTNSVNTDGSYVIHEIEIRSRGLEPGDTVIAYQDADKWEAEITFADDVWGVKLKSEAKEVSRERQEGHTEGFTQGVCLQKINTIKILKLLNAPEKLVEQVMAKLNIT